MISRSMFETVKGLMVVGIALEVTRFGSKAQRFSLGHAARCSARSATESKSGDERESQSPHGWNQATRRHEDHRNRARPPHPDSPLGGSDSGRALGADLRFDGACAT